MPCEARGWENSRQRAPALRLAPAPGSALASAPRRRRNARAGAAPAAAPAPRRRGSGPPRRRRRLPLPLRRRLRRTYPLKKRVVPHASFAASASSGGRAPGWKTILALSRFPPWAWGVLFRPCVESLRRSDLSLAWPARHVIDPVSPGSPPPPSPRRAGRISFVLLLGSHTPAPPAFQSWLAGRSRCRAFSCPRFTCSHRFLYFALIGGQWARARVPPKGRRTPLGGTCCGPTVKTWQATRDLLQQRGRSFGRATASADGRGTRAAAIFVALRAPAWHWRPPAETPASGFRWFAEKVSF